MRRLFVLGVLLFGWMFSLCLPLVAEKADDSQAKPLQLAMEKQYEPLDLSLFRDSIGHWETKDGRVHQFDRYRPDQIVHIAENFLRFQNEDGGWAKNVDWLTKADTQAIQKIRGGAMGSSTLDNRNTYPQIDYLSKVYQITRLDRYREGAERGLQYILNEQNASGGWRGKDVDAITYNDDVMTGVMRLLLQIRNQESQFEWINSELRSQLETSLARAIQVTLDCQIEVNGKKTAWCQQHDHKTLKATKARAYELPSITPSESTEVVRFLMTLPNPSEDVIAAVGAAVAWIDEVKIEGIRVQKISIDPIVFEHHTTTFDRIVVSDPDAPPIWARYYEIDTNQPFFCNRDGKKVYQLSDVHLERRTGYGWYTYKPAHVLFSEYANWKKQIAAN
ncbi:Pectic acid lyase [Polystyrenella longa]|uniref:Pectic acid lyase n=1 Tax=Polystyrenella longa TaxID=2528007 RepID=A0A518CN46_9PLAN|nr:pectate lyase [Polystyrenella longa]QDU80650.1 Pectic acid lyase [Polystyrenella longa]